MNMNVSDSISIPYEYWQAFICSGDSNLPRVRDIILKSWNRCVESGVDPQGSGPHDLLQGDSLAAAFGTIHTHQFVQKGRALGGARVIPLAVTEERLMRAENACRRSAPIVQVKPLKAERVSVVTTGSEIYSGRITDGFGPVLRKKFGILGSTVIEQILVSDEVEMTVQAIRSLVESGADLIAVTGGMSVDPDDQTPLGIRRAGAEIISYGAPTFPGAMFLLAYLGDIPVVGLPGCVMYHKASIFDLVVHKDPRRRAFDT